VGAGGVAERLPEDVSVGGVASPLVGALADATSLPIALAPLMALPALGWLFLRSLREPLPG
jgi:FSR family fosmidomycin resistance protein-like MFS transporter